MLRKMLLCSLAGLALAGCQTTPDIKQLQDQKSLLERQLTEANSQITQLRASEAVLQQDLAEQRRIIGVLDQEKSSRVESSTELRGQVRAFVQAQVDGLKSFMLRSNLLDYIGGELVERSNSPEEPHFVIDLANSMPRDGVLTGVGAYFTAPGSFSVKVLRKVEDNLVVIWESLPLSVEQPGMQRLNFSVTVGVKAGDYAAYYFNNPGMVGYDTGTGDSRYLKDNIGFGQSLRRSALLGEKQKRAYAIGVYGLLNNP